VFIPPEPGKRHARVAAASHDTYNDHFQVLRDPARGCLYAFWTQATREPMCDHHIAFRRSDDGGHTWRPLQILAGTLSTNRSDLAHTPGASWQQPMLTKTGRLYVLWSRNPDHLVGGRYSDDGGETWSEPEIVAFDPRTPREKAENQQRPDALEIRDNDFAMVLQSDAALLNFDGSELDSGTVAEFMAARFLDLPCVLLRTDFRSAGDQNADGEPWNLMLSGYPRTATLRYDCMSRYQTLFREYPMQEALQRYYTEMAEAAVEKLDTVYAMPPVYQTDAERSAAREFFIRTSGGTLPAKFLSKKTKK
jgi:nucleoside 2-deoxyribosyltransferase